MQSFLLNHLPLCKHPVSFVMQFRLNIICWKIYPPQFGNLFLAFARKSDCIELVFLAASVANVTIGGDQLRYYYYYYYQLRYYSGCPNDASYITIIIITISADINYYQQHTERKS